MVFFSAPGLLGRISLPSTRCTKIKPTPTARNSSRVATRGVMRNHPFSRGDGRLACRSLTRDSRAALRAFGVHQQLLPAGKAGVQLVPVGDLGFAQAPAQVDLP